MGVTPEEPEVIDDALRHLNKLSWGNITWTFHITRSPLELAVRSATQDIVHTPMRHDTAYRIVTDDLTLFCRDLLYAIRNVEKDYEKISGLLGAASSILALIIRDQFIGHPDPTPYLRRNCDEVRDVYNGLAHELPGFPIEIFTSYDFSAPKETLENARHMLRARALHLKGDIIRIENLLPLTTGFQTEDTLLFEPIDGYDTGHREAADFRRRLEAIASGSIRGPVFYHGQA